MRSTTSAGRCASPVAPTTRSRSWSSGSRSRTRPTPCSASSIWPSRRQRRASGRATGRARADPHGGIMRDMSIATEAVLPLVPSDEERQIREAVRGICDGFPEDYSRQKHAAGEPPTELWDALASKGYLGVNLPEEWGGGGLGMSGLAAGGEEIASAGKSLLLIVVSPAIVGNILARHGTDQQKERWLRGIAAGTTKVAFAITEPDAGTNSHNLSTSV